jgi:PKD repeat protein
MGFGLKKDCKRTVILGLIVVFVVIFASLIFADFQEGNPSHSIEKIYGPSFNVSGWINISFDEEPTDSLFSSFFDGSNGNSVNLEELLDKNPAYEHSCIPLDCGKDYSTSSGASSKSFTLNSNESKILGLKISSSQQITSISSFSMKVNSDAVSSTTPQLIIDILDDNETDWRAHKPHGQYNEKNYGCFDEGDVEGTAEITTIQYCQEIFLPAFPQVRIGAEVQEISGGNVNFTMSIDNAVLGYKSCSQNISGSGEISCVISDLKTGQTQDFFVCIRTKNTGDNNKYSVRHEVNNPCGFTGSFKDKYAFDFEIFAQTSLYDAIGNFILNNTEMQNSGSSGMIENEIISYINEKYGGDCSDECVIPIRFISGVDGQEIEVSDISLSYVAGISTTTKNIYDLIEDFPKISSDYQRFFIDKAGFSVPSDLDTYDFSLKLNNQEIFSEEIEVKDVPIIKSLKPRATAAGFPETFIVEVTNANISSCEWDFGDNSTITTSINKVIHIYSRTGTYNLKITVTDVEGFSSSRIFEINVSSPKDLIQSILNKMNSDIQNLKTDIQKQGFFQQTSLNSVLRIQNISSELEILEQRYEEATNESEYMAIVGDLVEIKLPENIFKTKEASSFLFFPEKDFIDMDIVQAIGGGEYEPKRIENYKNAIIAWQQENIDLRVNFAEFSGEYSLDRYDSEIKPVVNIFEIKVDEKKDIVHDYYLIVPELEGIGFNTNMEEADGFFYVNLGDVSGVNFYTTEDVDFEDLPAFVAPPLDKLVVTGPTIPSEEEKKQRVIIFILSLVFLVVAGIIAYVIIYHWYKKKYESYLFKNRNDLYNIVTYVNNSKKRGLNNREIIKNLKKAGWSSEQMRYVMRKYEGKRTGLVELPLIHFMKKVKKENSRQKQGKR